MYQVNLPFKELNEFDLPPVCIITGERQGVVFKPVKFKWYPRWIDRLAFLLPITAVVAYVMTKRVKGTLPFTEEAWNRWRRGKALLAATVVAAMALFVTGVALLSAGAPMPLGLGALALAVFLPMRTSASPLNGRGPQVVSIDEHTVTLTIPNDDAAQALVSHLLVGLQCPGWVGEEPLVANGDPTVPRCARHDGFIANKVCQRCGTFMCPNCEYRVRQESQPLCTNCWELRARSVEKVPFSGFTAPRKAVAGLFILMNLGAVLFIARHFWSSQP